jgi:hypothetical protein
VRLYGYTSNLAIILLATTFLLGYPSHKCGNIDAKITVNGNTRHNKTYSNLYSGEKMKKG